MSENSRKSVDRDLGAAKVTDNLDPMCSGLYKRMLEQFLEWRGSASTPPRVESDYPWLTVNVDLNVPVSSALVPDKPDVRAWGGPSEDVLRLVNTVKPSNSNRAVAPFVYVR